MHRGSGSISLAFRAAAAAALMITVATAGLAVAARPDSTSPEPPATRQVRFGLVRTGGELPDDLLRPEGKSRWDLTGLAVSSRFIHTVRAEGPRVFLATDEGDAGRNLPRRAEISDTAGGEAALRWLFPDRYPDLLRPGAGALLELREGSRQLSIELKTVGIGWLHLPSGPREVSLQRATLLRGPLPATAVNPTGPGVANASTGDAELIYRWVDRRAGVVAWTSVPQTSREAAPEEMQAFVLEEILSLLTPLKIYQHQLSAVPLTRITYGYDVALSGADPPVDVEVADLVPGLSPGATAGDLIALDSWDFSGNASSNITASHTTDQINESETCNFDECGYSIPGTELEREDRWVLLDPNQPLELFNGHNVTQSEVRFADPNNPSTPTDYTIWLRAGTVNEGRAASSLFATDGESHICYNDEGGETRNPVPLWRLPNQDVDGWFMQVGDPRASSDVFECDQTIFNEVCGDPGIISTLYIAGPSGQSCSRSGEQSIEIVKEGIVKLPSGHTFNALLARNVAEFCVYSNGSCSGFLAKVDEVRTVNYLWMVPYMGTVVRLRSPQKSERDCGGGEDPNLCFPKIIETDIKFGLFPPLSISVNPTGDNTVNLAWDPGDDASRITGFKVYWDTDSGGASGYTYNSESHSGQVSFGTNSAVISGLTAGTEYFFTVTSLSTFTNPASDVVTTYESLIFPTQVSGDPDFVYPVEVMGTTTGGACNPPEVTGVNVEMIGANEAQICWDLSPETCVADYEVGRAAVGDFGSCTSFTSAVDCHNDTTDPGIEGILYYLVRPQSPTVGTWGQSSDGERVFTCGS